VKCVESIAFSATSVWLLLVDICWTASTLQARKLREIPSPP
jgi:hypothetical protein